MGQAEFAPLYYEIIQPVLSGATSPPQPNTHGTQATTGPLKASDLNSGSRIGESGTQEQKTFTTQKALTKQRTSAPIENKEKQQVSQNTQEKTALRELKRLQALNRLANAQALSMISVRDVDKNPPARHRASSTPRSRMTRVKKTATKIGVETESHANEPMKKRSPTPVSARRSVSRGKERLMNSSSLVTGCSLKAAAIDHIQAKTEYLKTTGTLPPSQAQTETTPPPAWLPSSPPPPPSQSASASSSPTPFGSSPTGTRQRSGSAPVRERSGSTPRHKLVILENDGGDFNLNSSILTSIPPF